MQTDGLAVCIKPNPSKEAKFLVNGSQQPEKVSLAADRALLQGTRKDTDPACPPVRISPGPGRANNLPPSKFDAVPKMLRGQRQAPSLFATPVRQTERRRSVDPGSGSLDTDCRGARCGSVATPPSKTPFPRELPSKPPDSGRLEKRMKRSPELGHPRSRSVAPRSYKSKVRTPQ